MEIFNINNDNRKYVFGRSTEFDFSDLEGLKIESPDVVFYWYVCGNYEGDGMALLLKNNKWFLWDCSHCSCYGPIDHLNIDKLTSYNSLNDIEQKCSKELYEESVKILVDLAVSKGYK